MIHDTAKTYNYDAFISYNHVDKKAAGTIQHKLEKYRISKAIREKRGKTSSHLKVFRDETGLSAGNLEKNIIDALDMSAKLIVICSSKPAVNEGDKYKWVAREVQHFIDSGRSSDILPVVLDSGRSSDILPAVLDGRQDFLPQNIREMSDNQFIADASSLGKRKAFLKVLSVVLDTDFDALVKRANTRRCVWAVSLLAVFMTFAGYVDYYYVPHTTYYEDYVMRNGILEGVRALRRTERSRRSDVFAITIKRSRHEICLKHINSAGLLIEDDSVNHIEPPVMAVYSCLDDWTINTVDYLDENENRYALMHMLRI